MFTPLHRRDVDVLSDRLYVMLAERIIAGAYEPGERLSLADIAEEFEISKTPVREAIQRLARASLVEIDSGRWTRVATATAESRRHALDLASQLDASVAGLVLPSLEEQELDRIAELVAVPRGAAPSPGDAFARLRIMSASLSRHLDNALFAELVADADFTIRFHTSQRVPAPASVDLRRILFALSCAISAAEVRDVQDILRGVYTGDVRGGPLEERAADGIRA
ncbi:GntR family transcriptional regulator [Microbacterium sp. JZ101]